MSHRLPTGGRFIDRSAPLEFRFDGRPCAGFAGDTLASALLGTGQRVLGRSFKYHRPRGLLAAGPEEPNALMTLGRDARSEPNTPATRVPLVDGLEAASQNRWPSLAFDLGAVNGLVARLIPAGFYYKTFMAPRFGWHRLFEPLIRRAAGLGRVPTQPDPDRYEQIHAFCDLLVVGGGVAGLQAAAVAARAGQRVILLEQAAQLMLRSRVDGCRIDGFDAEGWLAELEEQLAQHENVQLRLNTVALGLYDHGLVLAEESVSGAPGAPRKRLWRIRAGRVVLATGAQERPLAFAGNDTPGVMLASAMRDYLFGWAVAPGRRVVVVTNNDDAYRSALALHDAGIEVAAVLDTRERAEGVLPGRARALGLRVLAGHGIAAVQGRGRVRGVQICRQAGTGIVTDEIVCDAVAMSGGWSPNVHLWSHSGGKLLWDDRQLHFVPDPQRPPSGADGGPLASVIGSANGSHDLAAILRAATLAVGGPEAAIPAVEPAPEAPLQPVWIMPEGAGPALRARMFLDFQNDVTVADLQLAAREGYVSVEHAKRYTTLGMAGDQGKLGNVNGLGVLADAVGTSIGQLGTTTFRPPFLPVTFGTLVAEARGPLFEPLRQLPLHARHHALGALWEPVGLWRRPTTYPQGGETALQSTNREVLAVRGAVGLCDASSLGKILVKGPDAGRFLDMIYTGRISTLAPGRCRYGLICNEQGFLIDDGVVVRLAADEWLCHTTSGGAARIHAMFEDWAQTEWPDWQVYILDQTEQFAQLVLAGPQARNVLAGLTGADISDAALPFMASTLAEVAGIAARLHRISFSGELSYEIAVPAAQAERLWEALMAAGAGLGITPYGTHALHVLRAEKGFIIVGEESDGSVTPQDLGLAWAVAAGKADFIGKRGMQRPALQDPERWRLVGLQSLDGAVLPEGAHIADNGQTAAGQARVQGRVTSSYWSPTLRQGIALALLRHGPERLGDEVTLPLIGGGMARARVVTPCRYDPDGVRQHV